MISIQTDNEIQEQENFGAIHFHALEIAAAATLMHIRPEQESDIGITLANEAQLQQLNSQFLGIDSPTDVLAFPDGDIDPDSQRVYLGDIIISIPRAASQAESGGHSLTAELQLLIVHGVLHLLGCDHARFEDKEAMWKIQGEILASISCEITQPV